MRYDAITLDTNIFTDGGYRLESGLFSQLSQFKNGSSRFVLSEIVHRELRRHLIQGSQERRDELLSVVKSSRFYGFFAAEELKLLTDICNTAALPEHIVDTRLQTFAAVNQMEVVPASGATIDEVLRLYFSPSPPFEPSGAKKEEFPDAIALVSLEAWAKDHDLKLLAVSKDKGWSAYANTSSRIAVQSDFATALSMFQEQHTEAQRFVSALITAAGEGRADTLLSDVEKSLADSVANLEVQAGLYSTEHIKPTLVDLELERIKLTGHDGKIAFKVVRTGSNSIVFTVLATLHVSASVAVSFQSWDEDYGDYQDYDEVGYAKGDWFESDLMIEISTDGLFPTIEAVELLEPIDEIDFGSVASTQEYEARRSK